MPRAHDDSWDLASSVGVTATMVAAGRAMATRDPRALINDPFAEPLVRAVGVDFFTMMMDGELDPAAFENASPVRLQAMIDGMAVRTKYFDDYFAAATAAGVRQAVILASGLDARAYRLPWPAGTVVYEIDQPEVIDFKSGALSAIGAAPTAERRTIPVTSPTAGSRRLLLMRLAHEGPVRPVGCYVRHVRRLGSVRDHSVGRRIPLA